MKVWQKPFALQSITIEKAVPTLRKQLLVPFKRVLYGGGASLVASDMNKKRSGRHRDPFVHADGGEDGPIPAMASPLTGHALSILTAHS